MIDRDIKETEEGKKPKTPQHRQMEEDGDTALGGKGEGGGETEGERCFQHGSRQLVSTCGEGEGVGRGGGRGGGTFLSQSKAQKGRSRSTALPSGFFSSSISCLQCFRVSNIPPACYCSDRWIWDL